MSAEGGASLARLGRRMVGFTPRTPAFEVAATWLLERSDYLRDLSEAEGIEADLSRAALWQLVEFLDQTEPDGRPLSAREALRRVRTVILMADDRDLREPGLGPDVDAVRLMTIHAAKGLEFGAVHLVGLHEGGFPLSYRTGVCQVPPGIEDGRDPKEAHAEEEDCAFFVGISRAQDHLRLYRTEMAAKRGRTPSSFLDDLGELPRERLDEPWFVAVARPVEAEGIALDRLTLQDLRDFEQCPLRLAYRHRMSIRGRRHEGPFLQASGVMYDVLDRLPEIASEGAAAPSAAAAVLERAWSERGPVGHSLEGKYRALVRAGVDALLALARGFVGSARLAVLVPIEGGHVAVPSPLLSADAKASRTARYVELGKGEPKDAKGLRAGMLHAAAALAAEERTAVQVAHLTGGAVIPITRTDGEAADDLARVSEILAIVRSGRLEPRPTMRVCMRCAHFFSCPATGAPRTL